MNIKQIITGLLLVFAAGSVVFMIAKEASNRSASTESPVSQSPDLLSEIPAAGRTVVVYYFHGDVRCVTCHKLESYAKEAIDTQFAEQLTSQAILWKPVNTDTPGNKHFVKDYELVTKSIILADYLDGKQVKWKNLERIWELVGDKEQYMTYIKDSINQFLEDNAS